MRILKDFPLKDLGSKLITIAILLLLFRIVQTHINYKNTENIKPTEFFLNYTAKKEKANLTKEKQTLNLTERFNTYIEEQAFLLSQIDKNSMEFEHRLEGIRKKLEKIETEAKKHQIHELIDHPLIAELRNNIKVYKRTLNG